MQKDFSYATNARMANCAGKRTASNYTLSAGIIARTNAQKSTSLAPIFSQSFEKTHEKTAQRMRLRKVEAPGRLRPDSPEVSRQTEIA